MLTQGFNMKEYMNKAGKMQGDMTPKVSDYEKPMKNFAEKGFEKVNEYIERKDSFEAKEAAALRKQDYKGRYS